MITILFVLLGGYIVLITQSSYLLDLVNKHCIVRKRGFEIERNSPINNVNNYLSSTLFIADDVFLLFQAYNCYDRFFSHYSSTKFSSVMYCIILPYHWIAGLLVIVWFISNYNSFVTYEYRQNVFTITFR